MLIKGTKQIPDSLSPALIISWLPGIFYLTNIYRMTGHMALPYTAMLLICGVLGISMLVLRRIERIDLLYIALALFIITGLINCFVVKNADYKEIGSDVMYLGMMIVMLAFPASYFQGLVIFYLGISPFVVGWLTHAGTHSFLTSSGNYISVLIILTASLYYMTVERTGHKFTLIDILPALLCFPISVWAKGRGGILCCVILLFLILFYFANTSAGKGRNSFLLITALILGVLAYLILSDVNLLDSFMSLGKWSNRGIDTTSRARIWGAYFDKIRENPIYFFTGAPLSQIPIVASLNNNVHNSFLQLHATNGLIPLLLIAGLLVSSMVWHIKNRRYLFAIVLFTIAVRGMTDKFVFGQYGMPIILYLVLYPYFDEYVKEKDNETL